MDFILDFGETWTVDPMTGIATGGPSLPSKLAPITDDGEEVLDPVLDGPGDHYPHDPLLPIVFGRHFVDRGDDMTLAGADKLPPKLPPILEDEDLPVLPPKLAPLTDDSEEVVDPVLDGPGDHHPYDPLPPIVLDRSHSAQDAIDRFLTETSVKEVISDTRDTRTEGLVATPGADTLPIDTHYDMTA